MAEGAPKDLLLLVWVHGFKGNEVTFESFPDRICHLLRSTHPSLRIESHVFPAYQTRGELVAATLAFVDWLTTLVVKLECDYGLGGGAGKAKIVLMGHSMGGLLIADAMRDIAANTREGDIMWPHVVGIIAFDTPYLGLHPHTFKHGLSTAATYYEQAKNVASAAGMLSPLAVGLGFGKWGKQTPTEPGPSKSSKWSTPPALAPALPEKEGEGSTSKAWLGAKSLYSIGAVALGAAALGGAYYRREDFLNGWNWGYEHMTFVRNLWDDEGMRTRLEDVDRLGRERNVLFLNYHTYLPPAPPEQLTSRTFCILPPTSHSLYKRFVSATNTLAKDEVSAHMGMFNPRTNDGFYDLGLEVVRSIAERIEEEGVGSIGQVSGSEKALTAEGWREEKQGDRTVWVEE